MLIDTSNKISYVGYTNNLIKRLNLHNSGKGAKFTRGRKWKLIYSSTFKTKNEAMKAEHKLKNDRNKRQTICRNFLKK